jgi:hypothetical protein
MLGIGFIVVRKRRTKERSEEVVTASSGAD